MYIMEWSLPLSVVELKKPMTQNKPFLEQVSDYIKSDDYMYAPMVGPPHSPQGTILLSVVDI